MYSLIAIVVAELALQTKLCHSRESGTASSVPTTYGKIKSRGSMNKLCAF